MYEKLKECPLCSSGHSSNFMIVKDHSVSKESFSISKCDNCGLLFTNPRPSEAHIGKYYQSEFYVSHQDVANNLTNWIYKLVRKFTLRQKVNWLQEFTKQKGRILDFGAGTGYFIKAAHRAGWETVGVEPDSAAAAIARKHTNMSIYENVSSLAQEKKFDVITLFHVVEHVHELRKTMELLIQKLKKRGVLLVAVPNFNSYDSQKYGVDWAALDVPRHLYHFTPESMEEFAKVFKLKLTATKPMVFDSYYVSLLSEKYKNNTNKYLNSIKNGYKSNKIAVKENNYSSLLFVFKKI